MMTKKLRAPILWRVGMCETWPYAYCDSARLLLCCYPFHLYSCAYFDTHADTLFTLLLQGRYFLQHTAGAQGSTAALHCRMQDTACVDWLQPDKLHVFVMQLFDNDSRVINITISDGQRELLSYVNLLQGRAWQKIALSGCIPIRYDAPNLSNHEFSWSRIFHLKRQLHI